MRHLKDDLALQKVLNHPLFAFITAPVSANLMAQAALHLRLRSMSGNVPETLDRPLPWQRQRRNLRRYEKKSHDDLV